MAVRKAWFVEEIEGEGSIAHRQSNAQFDDETGDWIKPETLDEYAQGIWDQVMGGLQSVEGQDLRCLIHPVTLSDFCAYCSSQQVVGQDLRAMALPDFTGFRPFRKKPPVPVE